MRESWKKTHQRLKHQSQKRVRKCAYPAFKLIFGCGHSFNCIKWFFLYMELREAKNNPEKVTQEQLNSLVSKVGKLIALPADEQPTVATVQTKKS